MNNLNWDSEDASSFQESVLRVLGKLINLYPWKNTATVTELWCVVCLCFWVTLKYTIS